MREQRMSPSPPSLLHASALDERSHAVALSFSGCVLSDFLSLLAAKRSIDSPSL